MRRAPIPIAPLSLSVSSAGSRFARLCSGSPMPITTMFVIRSSGVIRRSTCRICSMISPVVRFRLRPSIPLAQKTQPIAQPTCVLMQTVRRSSSRISTHSTNWPSCNSSRSFSVPSFATWCFTTFDVKRSNVSASRARNFAGTSCIDSKSRTRLPKTQRRIWSARYAPAPCSEHQAASSPRDRLASERGVIRPRRFPQPLPTPSGASRVRAARRWSPCRRRLRSDSRRRPAFLRVRSP